MEWLKIKLSDAAIISMGQSLPGHSYNTNGEGLPLFQGKREFEEIHPTALKWCTEPTGIAEFGDILMSVCAPVGPTNIANQKCCIGRGLAAIRAKKEIANQKYIYWLFKQIEPSISSRGQGSTFSAINRSDIEAINVPLPPLSEQKRIVEILDRADELRKQRAEADALSERILPALFIKMFGDPATNPMGWEQINLSSIAEDFRYGTSARCHLEKKGYPVLRIPNILKGEIDLSDLKYTELSSNEVERLLLKKGDLLFVRTNGNPDYVGRCAIADLSFPCLYASYLIRARLNQNKINPHFLFCYLQTPAGHQSMIPSVRTTAGQSNINIEGLKKIALFLPPITLQNSFVEKIDSVKLLSTRREESKLILENLFQNLLYRAFSGDLTAKWREGHMTELLQEMEHQAKALNLQPTLF
jgi:type I restriction enzyme S subunit